MEIQLEETEEAQLPIGTQEDKEETQLEETKEERLTVEMQGETKEEPGTISSPLGTSELKFRSHSSNGPELGS